MVLLLHQLNAFYDLISGHAFFKVNRMSFQERLLNGLSISWSEYSELNRMVNDATHRDIPSSFFNKHS